MLGEVVLRPVHEHTADAGIGVAMDVLREHTSGKTAGEPLGGGGGIDRGRPDHFTPGVQWVERPHERGPGCLLAAGPASGTLINCTFAKLHAGCISEVHCGTNVWDRLQNFGPHCL